MTAAGIGRSLHKLGLGGAFYLFGDDEFQKEEAARVLVGAHLDPATADFNLDALSGSGVDVEQLASVLGTPPMMAQWRVVLIREAEALASNARARDILLATAESPPPGLALILSVTVPARSRARFYRDLEARARSFQFKPVSPNDVPGWLVARARDGHGVDLEEPAARALGAAVGTDLGVLSQELQKLATFVGDRSRVTREDVQAAGIRLPRQDRWQWLDAVGERRFDHALSNLAALLAQNESGVRIVAGLATHLLRLGVALHGGRQALESALGRQNWLLKSLLTQSRGWSAPELDDALLGLLRVDRLLKSTPLGEQALLEEWLLARLATGREAA